MFDAGNMNRNYRASPRSKTPIGVIPARVAGIHRAAHANLTKAQGRTTTANSRRTEKWSPVTPACAGSGKHRGDAVGWFKALAILLRMQSRISRIRKQLPDKHWRVFRGRDTFDVIVCFAPDDNNPKRSLSARAAHAIGDARQYHAE